MFKPYKRPRLRLNIQSRSLLGDDSEENLITVCARCHQQLHRVRHPK